MRRQPDGTFRGAQQSVVVSPTVLRARWIESETIALKRMGLPFDGIAEQLTRVGRDLAQAITALPDNLSFPHEPSLELAELRKLNTARCEEMFMNLQPAMRKGSPRAIEVGVKVLEHMAKVNGCAIAQQHEVVVKRRRGGGLSDAAYDAIRNALLGIDKYE
jgi:hypothetical protein